MDVAKECLHEFTKQKANLILQKCQNAENNSKKKEILNTQKDIENYIADAKKQEVIWTKSK